jgi:hypothetical protein
VTARRWASGARREEEERAWQKGEVRGGGEEREQEGGRLPPLR